MPTLVNGSWRGALGTGGANHMVHAIALRGNDVFVGGQFQVIGRAWAWYSVARWDGTTWHDLVSEGSNGTVKALAFGPSGVLYAGGSFDKIGGVTTGGIAAWDGSNWNVLGGGLFYDVKAIAVDPAGNLYVAGTNLVAPLSPQRLMRWNGTTWTPLGNWLGEIYCLAWDPALSVLYAGGTFTSVDGGPANRVARWDGSSWTPLGAGVEPGMVFALAPDSGGVLYAGGTFQSSGGKTIRYLGKWDTTSGQWTDLGFAPTNTVRALLLKNGNLHVGGNFLYAVCQPRFKAWYPMGDVADVYCLALHPSGAIYAGGGFDVAHGVVAHSIAKWDGSIWSALGASESVSDRVEALVSDSAGNVYLAGAFGWAGLQSTDQVAKWNGSTWEFFSASYDLFTHGGSMNAIGIDSLGRLYVGGDLKGYPVQHALVYRLSGSGSSVLVERIGDGLDAEIKALALDLNGSVHVGGYFLNARNGPTVYLVNHLARWDGSKYVPVGGGVNNCVQTIAFDGAGHLYAGGYFTDAGGVAVSAIARWDGIAWSSLNGGTNGPVHALALGPAGEIYAGGLFTMAGGTSASNIARWNGTGWTPLGSGTNGQVRAIVVDSAGTVIACGIFTMAGGTAVSNIARWNGTAWQSLGAGLNGIPLALALDSAGNLAAGGLFSQADGKDSCCFAFYTATPVTVPTNPPGVGPPQPTGPAPTEPGPYPAWWVILITTVVGPRFRQWLAKALALSSR